MTDYISRQAAIDFAIELGKQGKQAFIVDCLKQIPNADVVEVVRCKDCKYCSPNKVYGCRIKSFDNEKDERLYADDYCSFGERADK